MEKKYSEGEDSQDERQRGRKPPFRLAQDDTKPALQDPIVRSDPIDSEQAVLRLPPFTKSQQLNSGSVQQIMSIMKMSKFVCFLLNGFPQLTYCTTITRDADALVEASWPDGSEHPYAVSPGENLSKKQANAISNFSLGILHFHVYLSIK
ncbi:hypothetical protein AAC387_Pa02g2119 [Persea americana]